MRKPTQQVFPQCLRAGWQHDSLCTAAQRFLQFPRPSLSLTLISHPGLRWALAAPIILRYHRLLGAAGERRPVLHLRRNVSLWELQAVRRCCRSTGNFPFPLTPYFLSPKEAAFDIICLRWIEWHSVSSRRHYAMHPRRPRCTRAIHQRPAARVMRRDRIACMRAHLGVTVTFAVQPVLWPAAIWTSVMVFVPRPQVLRASSAGLQVSRSRRTAAAPHCRPQPHGSRDMARAAWRAMCRSGARAVLRNQGCPCAE